VNLVKVRFTPLTLVFGLSFATGVECALVECNPSSPGIANFDKLKSIPLICISQVFQKAFQQFLLRSFQVLSQAVQVFSFGSWKDLLPNLAPTF